MRPDWRSALGLALSALLLWWALHEAPLGKVWEALAQSDWLLFAAATAVGTAIFPIRARKWRTILEPVAQRIAFGPLWRSTAIGMMVNNVVPARAGELARAYALTREVPRVAFPASLASLAVDRVFDAIVLLLLMFGALLDPAFPPDVRLAGQSVPMLARGGAVAVVVLLVGLYSFIALPHLFEAAFRAVARRVLPRVEERGAAALRAFADGLGALRHPARFAAVFGWTVVHWLVHALALWLGFRAVGIDVPYSAALFLQGLLGMAVAVPSSPGFFGVFEGAAVMGLSVYAVPSTLAISWALGYHILTFIPITVIGAIYFARLGLRLRDVSDAGGPPGGADAASPLAARVGERPA
ncbi:lysylphosphatidylglycerol synthase transmembrane domain-containing protein [Roseisolibacter agri]|uniref:TIGR00374 family protein n=1 Tax=Roseisolibacter agri TaxID=2014610 RepID=A0AA37VBF1_9BACT|nr:lysylphosphatidylglycerol synthase transmembrane domain-containing protein [Roseisolibacter agri]GLC26368.1 TIGR00374 family protein [Roseisolibacter agri]